jgi:hypothetical protein
MTIINIDRPIFQFLGASRFATFGGSRRAIRSITLGQTCAPEVRIRSAPTVVPLLSLSLRAPRRGARRRSAAKYEL